MFEFLISGNRKVSLPVTISVQPRRGEAVWNLETGKLVTAELSRTIKTNTLKIGRESISFVVPSIRFNDANLAGEGRVLEIEVDLPNGRVKLEAIGESYERIGMRTSIASYLIEAKIIYVNPLDEATFAHYLKHGDKSLPKQQETFVFGITER